MCGCVSFWCLVLMYPTGGRQCTYSWQRPKAVRWDQAKYVYIGGVRKIGPIACKKNTREISVILCFVLGFSETGDRQAKAEKEKVTPAPAKAETAAAQECCHSKTFGPGKAEPCKKWSHAKPDGFWDSSEWDSNPFKACPIRSLQYLKMGSQAA